MIRITAMLLAAAAPGACSAPAETPAAVPDRAPSGLEQVPVTIQSGDRTHQFLVEIARTPAEQDQGLMHRPSLDPNRGMLFPFDPPRPASFWMKNTLIPLDLIFIRPDGTIARIAENTVPHSLDPIPSLEPVSAVLEIAGGRASELGIEPGDRVIWTG